MTSVHARKAGRLLPPDRSDMPCVKTRGVRVRGGWLNGASLGWPANTSFGVLGYSWLRGLGQVTQ